MQIRNKRNPEKYLDKMREFYNMYVEKYYKEVMYDIITIKEFKELMKQLEDNLDNI